MPVGFRLGDLYTHPLAKSGQSADKDSDLSADLTVGELAHTLAHTTLQGRG